MVDVSRLIKGITQVAVNNPSTKLDPNAAGVGLLGEVINLGGAAADLGLKLQADADKVDAQDRLNKINAERRALLRGTAAVNPAFPDEDEGPVGGSAAVPGFFSLEKRAASDAAAATSDSLEEILKKHSEGASSGTQRLLAAQIANIRNTTQDQIIAHAATQRKAFELDVHTTAKREILQSNVAQARDTAAVIEGVGLAYDAELAQQLKTGADRKTAESQAESVATDQYLAVLEELAVNQDDPEAAKKLYDALVKNNTTSKRFDQDRRGEILKKIEAGRPVKAVTIASDDIIDVSKKGRKPLHTADGARSALEDARRKKFEGFSATKQAEMRKLLVADVKTRLNEIHTLHTREETDRDKEILQSANKLIGATNVKLSTLQITTLKKHGKYESYKKSHLNARLGLPGDTNPEKAKEWAAFKPADLAKMTETELEDKWIKHFADRKEGRDILTIEEVRDEWQAAQIAHATALSKQITLERTQRTEKSTAQKIGSYSSASDAAINSMGLSLTDNRKQIGNMKLNVQKDITRAVEANGGVRLSDAEVIEMYRRQAILIDFTGNESTSQLDPFDNIFVNAGIPNEFVDELADIIFKNKGQRTTTFSGRGAPLADPDEMIKLWSGMKEDIAELDPKSELSERLHASYARKDITNPTKKQLFSLYRDSVFAGLIRRK